MKTIHVGLLGCGTVGTGVAKILIENKDLIFSRVGAFLNLKYVADIDLKTHRGIQFDDGVLIPDAFKVVDDPDHVFLGCLARANGWACLGNGRYTTSPMRSTHSLESIIDKVNKNLLQLVGVSQG